MMTQGLRHNFLAGLSHVEVEQSRKKHGANVISKKKRKGFLAQYLASFGDPIIKILLIALAVNIIFLFKNSGGWYESAGIAVAVILATLVSTLSEYGSESAFEKLQQESGEISCRVRRNNTLFLLPITDLVVGDVVLLQAGERVPADGHVVSGELSVDQSALNGETKEALKYYDGGGLSDDLLSAGSLFQGSVVCEGDGAMRVDRVGDNTFYGKLALEVQEDTIESPLKMRLQKLAKTISRLGYTAAFIVAIANLFNAFVLECNFNTAVMLARVTDLSYVFGTIMNTLTLAITVIVMAVPEGLPMMITVVLSANMKKMLKDNVLVRKLVGIETAGSLNILFTDKTGTLTKGKLLVTTFLSGEGRCYPSAHELNQSPGLLEAVIQGCMCNTDSAISGAAEKKVIGGNGTDRALLEYALKHEYSLKDIELISHEPFNSKNKFSSSHVTKDGEDFYLIKGAPEIILSRCKYYLDAAGEKRPFKAACLKKTMHDLGQQAVRMLALAQASSPDMQSGLTLVGIMGIRDEIRGEARPAVKQLQGAGIQVVMITGDNKQTAVAIAKEVGLLSSHSENTVFTSEELADMSDEQVRDAMKDMRVVARALPSDKSRLVRISQEMGCVAGMTGDGINDAPALKKADVGFSMGAGTEVAKEAGDIVIIDNNISSIAKAVLYGRTIFKSIRKFIIFQLTMNLCAVGLSVICPFLGIDAPLTVMQMLWVNMIMDTLAGLAFSGEAPMPDYMREQPKKRDVSIINKYMYSQILFTGVFTTLLCVLFLTLPFSQKMFHFAQGGDYFMTAFFALFIFLGVFNSLNARTHRIDISANLMRNKLFIVIMLLICAVQILLIYFGGSIFRTTPISAVHLQLIIILALCVIPADLLRKLFLRAAGKKGGV